MTVSAEPACPPRKILVLGLGNPDRGDDGVGAMVVRALGGRLPADIVLLSRNGDMLSLIEEWAGFDALVCVDAAAPKGTPGRIHRIDLTVEDLPPDASFTSSHALGLAEAIALARTLQAAPWDIIVYAVEGSCFAGGAPVTPVVAAAAGVVAGRIITEVGRLRGSPVAAAGHSCDQGPPRSRRIPTGG